MNEKEIQSLLAPFSARHQVAFLVGCVEHVSPIYINSKFSELSKKAVDLSWNFVVSGIFNIEAAKLIDNEMGNLVEVDGSSSLIFISTALRLVAVSARSPNDNIQKILNNIEEAIDIVDDEAGADVGCSDERLWQEKILKKVQESNDAALVRDMFAEFSREKMGWVTRMENS